MDAYVFRIAVVKSQGSWRLREFWSDGETTEFGRPFRWRWQALRTAHFMARVIVEMRGTNLRMEVTTPNKIERVYGRDPRSIT